MNKVGVSYCLNFESRLLSTSWLLSLKYIWQSLDSWEVALANVVCLAAYHRMMLIITHPTSSRPFYQKEMRIAA